MTTPLASSTFSPVLADHFGSASLRRDALAVLTGAGLVGILAQVAIPMWPVPITGQTLGVLLVGAVLGARRGALSTGVLSGTRPGWSTVVLVCKWRSCCTCKAVFWFHHRLHSGRMVDRKAL